jgi:hypothetical protein
LEGIAPGSDVTRSRHPDLRFEFEDLLLGAEGYALLYRRRPGNLDSEGLAVEVRVYYAEEQAWEQQGQASSRAKVGGRLRGQLEGLPARRNRDELVGYAAAARLRHSVTDTR